MGQYRNIYRTINIMRLIIACLVILGSLHDIILSYYDSELQRVATSEMMGYQTLENFRLHMIRSVFFALIYILAVIIHKRYLSGRTWCIIMIIIDLCIIVSHIYRMAFII